MRCDRCGTFIDIPNTVPPSVRVRCRACVAATAGQDYRRALAAAAESYASPVPVKFHNREAR